MIKFILHGGRSQIDCENNRKFYQEIVNLDKKEINFLIVSFAKPKDQRDFSEQIEKFIRFNPEKEINFNQASEGNFEEQIKDSDVIYLRGGDTGSLKKELVKIADLKKPFDGKTVAGSSAGFIVLSKYYYDQDYDKIMEGLNILPIKAISHFGLPNQYGQDFEDELKELEEFKKEEDLETIALKETEFIVKEIL